MRYVPGIRLHGGLIRHRFADLQELYETNYRLLRRLVPDIGAVAGEACSRVAGCLDLHLSVVERHKYTTILSLTYLFDREGGPVAEPGLLIRLYHDAKLAQVGACGACVGAAASPRGHGHPDPLIRQWEAGLFLEKWLVYCLERGHRFPPTERRRFARDAAPALAGRG